MPEVKQGRLSRGRPARFCAFSLAGEQVSPGEGSLLQKPETRHLAAQQPTADIGDIREYTHTITMASHISQVRKALVAIIPVS